MVALTLGKIKLVNRGTWSGTATYSLGDVVEYQGNSYVYRNTTAKQYTSLFFSSLSSFPLTGTASYAANSNTVVVTWTTPLQSTTDNRIVADGTLAGDLYIYSSFIEPDSRITSIVNQSVTQSTITMSRYSTNNTAVSGNSVTVGPRRLAGTYEVALNKTDWDRLSESYSYAGVWGTSNTYVEGSIVQRNNNSYLCTFGNTGIDPLFDYVGVWEPFLVGNDALPHERIVTGVNSNPIYWRGHPYVPNPTWGTVNTYNGIPWNLPSAQRTNYWSGVWNTPWQRGYIDYRGAMDYGADGRGNRITKGYGYYGNAPGTSDTYRDLAGEHAAQHNQDYFTDTQTHWGYETFATNFPKSQAPRVTQALHGWVNRFQLMSNGTIQGSGYPYYGVLSGAYGNDQTWPLISLDRSQFNNRSIVKMTTGECYSRDSTGWCMALDEYGELWCWGSNDFGQCGVGPENFQTAKTGYRQGNAATNPVVSPVCLEKDINFNGNRIVDIFTMYRSAFALDETGTLWAWGRNNYGQLGYPTTNAALFANSGYSCAPYPIPINWTTYGGIQKVFCCSYENNDWLMVLDGQGNVWNCGYNDAGQLGRNSTTSDTNASTIQRTSVVNSWTGAGSIRNIWAVTGGCNISYYSDASNQLWGMGNGGNYNFGTTTGNQLLPILMYGPNGVMTNIVMITNSGRAGGNTQVALDINGITYACGWNQYGEGGVGYATYPGNNNSMNQQFGQNATLTGWARVIQPGNIYENGNNQIVDLHGYGDYDGTSGHVPLNIWRTARGEVFTAGRAYNYSTDIQSGDKWVPYPVKNMS